MSALIGSWVRPIADHAVELEVRLREVIPYRDQRLVRKLRSGVGHRVAEVERRGVASLAVLKVGTVRCEGVVRSEIQDGQIDLALQSIESRAGDGTVATAEDDQALDNAGRSNGRTAIGCKRSQHLFDMRVFALQYGDNGTGIDDHNYTPV